MSPDEAIRNLLHYVGDGAGLMRSEHVKFRNGRYDSDSSSSNMEHNYQVQQAIANARAAADQLERVDSAPAGGDYPTEADGLALELVSVTEERDFLRRRVAELSAPAGGDESCPLCGSNDCECADEQEDLKAYPCGKPPDSAPAGSGEVEEYDWDAAHEALESIDDYARMDVGVAPHGPYTVLRDLLTKAKGWQEAAALLRKLQQGADHG